MPIAAINYKKISGERKKPIQGTVNIQNNIAITDVSKKESSLKDQVIIDVEFQFTALFEPSIGSINIIGDVTVIETSKKADEILAEWKKNNQLSKDLLKPIMNSLLAKCNIEAILLGKELGLPPTLAMPKLTEKEKK